MINVELFEEAFSIATPVKTVNEAFSEEGDLIIQYKSKSDWHSMSIVSFEKTLKEWAATKGLDLSCEEDLDEIIYQCEKAFKQLN